MNSTKKTSLGDIRLDFVFDFSRVACTTVSRNVRDLRRVSVLTEFFKSSRKMLVITSLFFHFSYYAANAQQYHVGLVADINPDGSSIPIDLATLNDHLFFRAITPAAGPELFRYDGNTVSLVQDAELGTSGSNPQGMVAFNGQLYFNAETSAVGRELFRSNGSNVELVQDLVAGSGGSFPTAFATYNNQLFFQAHTPSTGTELFRYDGSGVSLVSEVLPGSTGSFPGTGVVFGGALYFPANSPTAGRELFKYDGTSISLVSDVNPGSNDSSPYGLIVYGGELFFSAIGAGIGRELYRYDGADVHLVADVNFGPTDGVSSELLTEYHNAIYFRGSDATNGNELFKYDGSNVSVVDNIRPGSLSGFPLDLTLFDDQLFFHASDGTRKLFRYDGGSTIRSVEFDSPTSLLINNESGELYVFNGDLYLIASDGIHGRELFKVSVVPEPSGSTTAILCALFTSVVHCTRRSTSRFR